MVRSSPPLRSIPPPLPAKTASRACAGTRPSPGWSRNKRYWERLFPVREGRFCRRGGLLSGKPCATTRGTTRHKFSRHASLLQGKAWRPALKMPPFLISTVASCFSPPLRRTGGPPYPCHTEQPLFVPRSRSACHPAACSTRNTRPGSTTANCLGIRRKFSGRSVWKNLAGGLGGKTR